VSAHGAHAQLRLAARPGCINLDAQPDGEKPAPALEMLDRRTENSLQDHAPRSGDPPERLGMLRFAMLAPFGTRSFRFQWPADLLTSWAFEMETIILGWFVLVETGSVLWLTAFGALQYLGTLIAPIYGVIGDRFGHRSLLLGMRAIYAVCASVLLTLAVFGAVTPLAALIVASFMGLVRPSDLGVRSALIAETMPSRTLISALSISRTTTDSARVAGALAGATLFTLFGMAPTYVIITSFYVVGTLLMFGDTAPLRQVALAMTPEEAAGKSSWRDLKEGVAHTWNTPILLGLVSLAFLTNLSAFPLTNGLMPYVARDVYGLGQTGLGFLVASFAGGALIGSIILSNVSGGTRLTRLMIVASLIWYAMLIVFAQMPGPGSAIPCLIAAGIMQSFSMVSLQISLLREAGERFRGRVMGVRMMAIYSLPLGLLAAGSLIEWIGFRGTASLYATVGLVFVLIIALRWRADLWRA
jgi:predicted MFS family arabinose efflux permease